MGHHGVENGRPIAITIAVLTYNRRRLLEEALAAICQQTYRDFELLVLDNHSTDDTAAFVLGWPDPRVTYIRQPPGGTPSSNTLCAMRMARGHHLLITHDDDVMEPMFLERCMAHLEKHPDLLCLATNVSLIDEHGALLQERLYEVDEDICFGRGDYIRTYLEEKMWLPTPTQVWRRDALVRRAGATVFAEDMPYVPSGDIVELLIQNQKGPIGFLAEPLLRYRQHPGQESRNVDQGSPLFALAKELLRSLVTTRRCPELLSAVRGFVARFGAQELLVHGEAKEGVGAVLKEVRRLRSGWVRAVPAPKRAVDAVLPFEILLAELGLPPTLPRTGLLELCDRPAANAAQAAYRQWALLVGEGRSLFRPAHRGGRIAVVGSLLAAFLIILDARRAGLEVVACLDSSPARQGCSVLGVPVMPQEALRQLGGDLDAVILSSERAHEAALQQLLESHMEGRPLPVCSWKDLAMGDVWEDWVPRGQDSCFEEVVS
nr:glycosyltransferase family A protein [uncultured Holophaga sp.]